jgi:hypothetical protein
LTDLREPSPLRKATISTSTVLDELEEILKMLLLSQECQVRVRLQELTVGRVAVCG